MNTATNLDPIFQYILSCDIGKLQELLGRDGTDPNILQKDGLCPLHMAAVLGNQEILGSLLKHVRYI
jgi:ankyrin repeat protein